MKLPNSWKYQSLKDIIKDTQLGVNVKSSVDTVGIPLLKMGNLTIGDFNFNKLENTCELIENIENYYLKYGDFLFNTRNTPELVGKSAVWKWNDKKIIFNSNIMRINFIENIDSFFLGYYFSSKRGWNKLKLISTGTTSVGAIYTKDLLKVKVPLPPLEEQKKITDILTTVDKKIAFVEENINATEELKKSLMQKLLTEGIGHTEFKDSELGRIPESWEIKSLSKVCNKVVDKNKDLLYVNVLTNSATLGIISQNEYFDREIVTEKNLVNYFVVNKFDYIYNPRISINAPCGPINQCKKYENGIVSPLYTVFRIEKDSINNDYLEFYFLSNHWNKYIKDNSNTGARHDRMSISDKLFFSMPIFIPPVEEQKQIAEILSTVDKKLENLKEKKQSFEELKKGLMQKLLTGEVRV